ncbi:MAG: hypothetical protein ACK5TK_05840 [Betaproteobacteria bacterium]
MNRTPLLAMTLIAAVCAAPVLAQQPRAQGGVAVVSEPGKAMVANAVQISAQVVAIDKATRTVTLKGASGEPVDVVAGPEVKNFDRIKVGDTVVARYLEALTLELRKSGAGSGDVKVAEGAARAKPGEKPAVAGARQVTATTDVIAVDPVKSTITLKGPRGNRQTLNVRDPEQFKVVKVGDKVDVIYTEALALSVEPAPAGKK